MVVDYPVARWLPVSSVDGGPVDGDQLVTGTVVGVAAGACGCADPPGVPGWCGEEHQPSVVVGHHGKGSERGRSVVHVDDDLVTRNAVELSSGGVRDARSAWVRKVDPVGHRDSDAAGATTGEAHRHLQ